MHSQRIVVAIPSEKTPSEIIVLSAKQNDKIRCQKTLRKAIDSSIREWHHVSSHAKQVKHTEGIFDIGVVARWRDNALNVLMQNEGIIDLKISKVQLADNWTRETSLGDIL